ncbi:MAG: ACT domain-containing protein [Planctomycetota bacterium]
MIRQLRVTLPNQPGTLARMVSALAEAGVDMKALEVSERGPGTNGEASLIVSDVERAVAALRGSGHSVEVEAAIAVEMDDRVGGLAPVLAALAADEINVRQLYAFVTRVAGKSLAVLTLDEPERAHGLLERKGFHLLDTGSLEGKSPEDDLGAYLGLIW